ncbi:helix-turn-helix domain-containing protein [Limosilactobacillus reuteri]|uniref:helix-turn-helix domain-containing protein n=1 Tax=Limosilactobacillus reuteri TaxID=1598 RepID=UPI0015DFB463|nr:helix-turn-helix transcriptional regulator [Limosilactobacillus reuteri]QLL75794.1 helix-turn-helix domain-containing protein [Limosilactobacillus reuteri]
MSDLGNKDVMAQNIKRLMDQRGITRRKMASDLDISYTTLSMWLQANSYPRIDKIEKMANYFGVQKSELVEAKHNTNEAAETVAAHIDEDTPVQEREQIINFIENLKKARK